jgi:hypothetical protein
MEWMIGASVLAAMVAILVFGVVLLGYRVIHGIRVYFRFWGDQSGNLPRDAQDRSG